MIFSCNYQTGRHLKCTRGGTGRPYLKWQASFSWKIKFLHNLCIDMCFLLMNGSVSQRHKFCSNVWRYLRTRSHRHHLTSMSVSACIDQLGLRYQWNFATTLKEVTFFFSTVLLSEDFTLSMWEQTWHKIGKLSFYFAISTQPASNPTSRILKLQST